MTSTTNTPQLTDQQFLQRKTRPEYESGESAIRVVDLFAGCGALSVGFAESIRRLGFALDVRLALDSDVSSTEVYKANFPNASVKCADIETIIDGALGADPTEAESEMIASVGAVDLLAAGPPCQGHSSLNNHTRTDDPRNSLYGRVVRAAEILDPKLIVIENVPGVLRDKRAAIPAAVKHLKSLGYKTTNRTIAINALGVPQRRRRHLLIAAKTFDPGPVLDQIVKKVYPVRDVRWAIEDLKSVKSSSQYDQPGRLSQDNVDRIAWLFTKRKYDLPNELRPKCHRDVEHTYKAMYGRLKWDLPAQTITTGFGSPGQGRYVHPGKRRTITPHEAARLQTIPDFFKFDTVVSRGSWARMIGNAVPPLLSLRLGLELLPQIAQQAIPEKLEQNVA